MTKRVISALVRRLCRESLWQKPKLLMVLDGIFLGIEFFAKCWIHPEQMKGQSRQTTRVGSTSSLFLHSLWSEAWRALNTGRDLVYCVSRDEVLSARIPTRFTYCQQSHSQPR